MNEKYWESGSNNHRKRSSGLKDMGFGSFQGQNGPFRSFWVFSGILEWIEGAKDNGSSEIWEFFKEF
jgi:hypothetical protein